jgi:hypothetical protein
LIFGDNDRGNTHKGVGVFFIAVGIDPTGGELFSMGKRTFLVLWGEGELVYFLDETLLVGCGGVF